MTTRMRGSVDEMVFDLAQSGFVWARVEDGPLTPLVDLQSDADYATRTGIADELCLWKGTESAPKLLAQARCYRWAELPERLEEIARETFPEVAAMAALLYRDQELAKWLPAAKGYFVEYGPEGREWAEGVYVQLPAVLRREVSLDSFLAQARD